jgi:hypothetical protein
MYAKFVAAISANRRMWIVLLVFASLPFLIKTAWLSSSAQSPEAAGQERKLKMKEGISVPLEVKVRNLQSDTWLKDLEIEVKNVGKKPIYSIVAYVMLPDDKRAERVGIPLDYGNPKNVDISRYSEAGDPHIDPGDTYVFKIDEQLQKGFEKNVKESPEVYKKLELWFAIISFGDGTGLVNGGSRDHRKKAEIPTTSDESQKKRSNDAMALFTLTPQPHHAH